jgi:hypothetical protein
MSALFRKRPMKPILLKSVVWMAVFSGFRMSFGEVLDGQAGAG